MLQYLGTQGQSRKSKKRDKYQDLQIELRRLWDKPVEIDPIITRGIRHCTQVPKEEHRRVGS